MSEVRVVDHIGTHIDAPRAISWAVDAAVPINVPKIRYSFVVDAHGPFGYQGYLLARSLIAFGGVAADEITANLVRGTSETIEIVFQSLGVRTRRIEPFPDHPYCNKIQQLDGLDTLDADGVVLLDTDTFVTAPLGLGYCDTILGKMVDLPNPPLAILENIYQKAGVQLAQAAADISPKPTARANFNGGLYVIPGTKIKCLHVAWDEMARWCIANIELFDKWHIHVDQVAFALAVAQLGLPVRVLPRTLNFPTHHGALFANSRPTVLHYHRQMDRQLFLLPTGNPIVDSAITFANDAIRTWRANELPNSLFWSARYALDPALGSGVGSRGECLADKRKLIVSLVAALKPGSVLDIGAGDGAVLEGLVDGLVHGAMDIAPGAGALYLKRNPAASFTVGDITNEPAKHAADFAICLDVLIHLVDRDRYLNAVRNTIRSGQFATLISGFDDQPVICSSITHYHEPLLETIDRLNDVVAIPLHAYRGVVAYLVLAEPAIRHPRDITASKLRRVLPFAGDRLALLQCIGASRREFGFFPNHIARGVEYPWILAKIRAMGTVGLRIADIGAGINILPVMLHDEGHALTTIDSHPIKRSDQEQSAWTEWGFLDYARLRTGIRSVHTSYEQYEATEPFDVIYSVSVIEHLPAVTRRQWLASMAQQVRRDGIVLLTVDTFPFSRSLWNYSEGKIVEDCAAHGTVDDLIDEIEDAGFLIELTQTVEWLPASRVSIVLIAARKF